MAKAKEDAELDAAAEKEPAMPAEISAEPGHERRAAAVARVEVFFADTRHFLSTLDYEFDGETGEILAYLRKRLG